LVRGCSERSGAALPHGRQDDAMGRFELGRLLNEQHERLTEMALSNGLGDIRHRCAAGRLPWEGQRFVHLLATVVSEGSRLTTTLDEAVAAEVREGALAGAGPAQTAAALDVWRVAMKALCSNQSDGRFGGWVDYAFDIVEDLAVNAARRWE